MKEVKQFKLSNGEEIVCQVLEWPSDEGVEVVVRRALSIKTGVDKNANRYYTFIPWMACQEKYDSIIALNYQHIIGEANPDTIMTKHYLDAVKYNEADEEELEKEFERLSAKIKDAVAKLQDEEEIMFDSDGDDNVLQFPLKNRTIH